MVSRKGRLEMTPSTVESIVGLFGREVIVLTSLVDAEATQSLGPGEQVLVRDAVRKRQIEFATVRKLARQALAVLGMPASEILHDREGAPVWPEGVAGSLTHCTTRGLVAIGRAGELGTVGIDAEDRVELPDHVWSLVFDEREAQFLEAQPPAERARSALMMFSAKEAFYKAQFPRSKTVLNFGDVCVERVQRETPDRFEGTFSCRLLREVPNLPSEQPYAGRFLEIGPERTIVTGVQMFDVARR